MAVTVTAYRIGSVVELRATSTLPEPSYYWWIDGLHVATTSVGQWSLHLPSTDPVRVDVFDSSTDTPSALPCRRVVWFTRGSAGTDTASVRVQQSADGGGTWTTLAEIPAAGAWAWGVTTPKLTDLTTYQWRALHIDSAGNVGSGTSSLAEFVLRTPDAPSWSLAYDSGTNRVIFSV